MRLLDSRRGPFKYFHVVLALATLAVAPIVAAGAQAQPTVAGKSNAPLVTHSLVIPGDSARGIGRDASVRMRSILDTATSTLRRLEVHFTTLVPGASPHAAHRHAHEELMLVERGTLEVTQEGAVRRAGPGSLILEAANELHGLRNAGADTAFYWVIAIYPRDLPDSAARRP
jgi:mannose-6-phosphate isomerase-like protein (cupin superfamily)